MSELGVMISRVLEGRPERISAGWLFGSRASGRERPDSDVDVAVLMTNEPPRTLEGLGLDIAGALEDELDLPVDLIVLNRVPVELVHVVLSTGELVYETNAAHRVTFEVKARAEYFDLLPILERYRAPRRPLQ